MGIRPATGDGVEFFLVGGAVRDALLGLEVRERDWVVVGASPRTLLERGFTCPDPLFPVFLHPQSGEEYALARRERKCSTGHRGFRFETGPDVTLEQDLARRDLRVNAIAEAADGSLIDPFDGRDDLERRILRHVTPAFVEDPLRVLRAARFASVLAPLGFELAPATQALMRSMASAGEFLSLSRERIWRETARALAGPSPQLYFEALQTAGALVPLLGVGFGPPPVDALARIAACTSAVDIRLAAFAADWHADGAGEIAAGLGADRARSELARLAGSLGIALLACEQPGGEFMMTLIEKLDGLRRPPRMEAFVAACRALARAGGHTDRAPCLLERCAAAAAGVQARGLIEDGMTAGPALGKALRQRRVEAIESIVRAVRA